MVESGWVGKNGSTRYDVVDVATDRPLRTHTHIREKNFVDNPRTRQITEEGDEEQQQQKKKKTGTKK